MHPWRVRSDTSSVSEEQQEVMFNGASARKNGAGNMKKIGSDTFAYDGVSRLTSATVRGITKWYTYDAFGNRLTASSGSHGCAGGIGCAITVTTDSASNRVTQATIGTTNYASSYDDAGNMASFAGVSFTYDSLGSMVTRNDGEGPLYVYDANDERVGVLATTTSTWTWTLRDVAGRQLREYTVAADAGKTKWSTNAWTWKRDHIYRGDQVLASVTPSGAGTVMQHLHLDHLGTPRMITVNGTEVAFKTYYPFGAEAASAPVESPAENHTFTGHEFDDAGNGRFATDYMHARYYNATAGRFLSVDAVLGNSHQPQSWNRYAYVENN